MGVYLRFKGEINKCKIFHKTFSEKYPSDFLMYIKVSGFAELHNAIQSDYWEGSGVIK